MDKALELKQLFYNGKLYDGYNYFGCHFNKADNSAEFRVWAPSAQSVALAGDFNDWSTTASPMQCDGGIWTVKIPAVRQFDKYKYYIVSKSGNAVYKSDPYAFHGSTHGETDSKIYDLADIKFTDSKWEAQKRKESLYDKPVNIYEAHIGSWQRFADGNTQNYRVFADNIVPYLKDMNYTHIELMGIAEYPFDGSWGYQVTGYFAPTSRYGTPADFAYLVDKLHNNNIGVILDWVPGHFPKDLSGLYEFDGAPLYEPSDPLKKEHLEWGTRCFDYGRGEVKSFLISNALYWLDVFHIDGLRVDAVASMLYLDYNRKEWRPNSHGGKENLEAIDFLKQLNTAVFASYPGVMMIAEESTAWPLVTKPVSDGGLGFNFKWNMGWMNDTLSYAKTDPFFKSGSHNKLTFSMTYAFSENYILPISHDEVVHGKGSLVNKMPGEYEQKFAGWRNYLMNMFAHPGKKVVFMGTEFAQFSEWDFAKELDWSLFEFPAHKDAAEFSKALNKAYVENSQLWQIEDSWDGFAWLVADDYAQNIIIYERRDKAGNRLIAVFNFSPVEYKNYSFGCEAGVFETILSSDLDGWNTKKVKHKTRALQSHGKSDSITMDILPLSGVYMVCKGISGKATAPKSAKTASKAAVAKTTKK